MRLTNPSDNVTISPLSQDSNAFIIDDDGPGLLVAASLGGAEDVGPAPNAAQLEATLDAAA
ncbi:hypothetical protein D3C83_285850 [compost metagenome]